jgi:hypothetical protein
MVDRNPKKRAEYLALLIEQPAELEAVLGRMEKFLSNIDSENFLDAQLLRDLEIMIEHCYATSRSVVVRGIFNRGDCAEN